MEPLWKQPLFWAAIIFATAVKWRASPSVSLVGSAISTVAAIAGALVFTEPITDWLAIGGTNTRFAVAGLVALTCEHLGRILLGLTLADLASIWRGGK